MKARTIIFVFPIFLAMGCTDMAAGGSGEEETREQVLALASLSRAEGCDEVLDELRRGAIADMEEKVEANLKAVLDGEYCYDYDDYYDYPVYDTAADAGSYTDYPPSEESDVPDEASEYSETNVQVAGVDEADFIKNDGGHIYILADGKLKIIDSWPAEESHLVSSLDIEGDPMKLFVYEGRAVVYSAPAVTGDAYDPYYRPGNCTYGYDCEFTGDGRPLKITVIDIADLDNPVVLRETWFSGSYINSRRIGGAVYTVVTFPEMRFPSLPVWPEEFERYCPQGGIIEAARIRAAFASLKAANRETILQTPITDWLPNVRDSITQGGTTTLSEGLLESCENFYRSQIADGTSFLTIVSFNMEALDPLSMATVVGRPGAVYASRDALYVAARHNAGDAAWYYDEADSIREVTTVHKFALLSDVPEAVYSASGVAKGRVLNQFSMDEHEGYLRIATTTGRVPDPSVHSTVSVLEDRGTTLEVAGMIDNIAPTEDIRSVRFDGPRGFVVTFKKTDPLFVLNMEDPANPVIEGELKIPGFSTYMQMMDDTHIISIGYDADDQGSFAWFTGIMLQIFDVSKLDDPQLLHKEVIGTRGSTSDAATDHMAFNYFPPRDALAIPITICEDSSGDGSYGTTMTFSGLLVYRATTDLGFEELGRVSHAEPEVDIDPYASVCYNWWTQSNSVVKRSIFMEDYVFSVAPDQIKVNHLDTLGADLAVISLTD